MTFDPPYLVSSQGRPLLTYGQLDTWVETTSRKLRQLGIGPGALVVTDLPNSPAFAAILLASWRLGAAFAPMDSALSVSEKDIVVRLVRPQVFVTTALLSPHTSMLVWPEPFSPPSRLTVRYSPTTPPSALTDLARLVLFTAADAEKEPRAVVLTDTNVVTGISSISRHFRLTDEDCTVAMVPWSRGHGLFATLLAAYRTGGRIVLPERSEMSHPRWLLDAGPSWLSLVPAQLSRVVSARRNGTLVAESALRFIRTSSAALPVAIAEQAEDLLGCPVAEALGLAETSHQATADLPTWDRVPGTVGSPIGLRARLAGDVVCGAQELQVRGAAVFAHYLDNDRANEEAFTDDGWFRTGDLARWHSSGNLRIVGRLGDRVNRGGDKVAPAEVESVLAQHPEVLAVVATGIPHAHLGHDLAAVVTLRNGSKIEERELLAYCRTRLAEYKVPGSIRILEALPRSPQGHPNRRLVAQLLAHDDN